MRDDFQFAALAVIALALIVGEIILAITASDPTSLHGVLLVVVGGLVGVAIPGKGAPK